MHVEGYDIKDKMLKERRDWVYEQKMLFNKIPQDLEKYNKGGHKLEWNGKLGKEEFSADEGIIRCFRCEKRWSWKHRVNNLCRTKCDGNPEAARKEKQKSVAGIAEWMQQHPYHTPPLLQLPWPPSTKKKLTPQIQ